MTWGDYFYVEIVPDIALFILCSLPIIFAFIGLLGSYVRGARCGVCRGKLQHGFHCPHCNGPL